MNGSKVNPYQFAKNINNVKKLEDDIYDNPWINNLIDNEIVNRGNDVNINKSEVWKLVLIVLTAILLIELFYGWRIGARR